MNAGLGGAPDPNELEVTLIGPGYGESVVVHLGEGAWMIVDSCVDSTGEPRPLRYLEQIGVDPAESVGLVVATHWHDDHIRGMEEVVARCGRARFCCSAVLRTKEFLAAARTLEGRRQSQLGSGVREMHGVFSRLDRSRQPLWALADRRVHRWSTAEVWALSPDDSTFERFLHVLASLTPESGQAKRRLSEPSPNEVSVVLWLAGGDVVVLLGADLERAGWARILAGKARPEGMASAYKVPHHGSEGADAPAVWEKLLAPSPMAVLAPWTRGGRVLPTEKDSHRILDHTRHAYITAPPRSGGKWKGIREVERTLRESGAVVRADRESDGVVRLRRPLNGGACWSVALFGSAIRLADAVAA